MKSQINLVFLTPGFAANESDTAAIPSLQLYFRWLHSVHPEIHVNIISIHYPRHKPVYKWHGIPVYTCGKGRSIAGRLLSWVNALFILRKLYHRKEADIIHCFWLTGATLAGLVFHIFSGVPIMATAMGQDVQKTNLYLRILRKFQLKINLISGYQRQFLTEKGKMKITGVIPFGVDPAFYEEDHRNRSLDLLGVGNQNRIKDYPLFLRVVKEVTEEFPELRCRIVGNGPESKAIMLLVREQGLEKNISFTGSLPYKEVQDEMLSSKVLLHTSMFEGQGLVITEALAAGMYVVTTPVGISDEIRSEKVKTGRSERELSAHITDILRMNNPDYGKNITLTMDHTIEKYLEMYHQLLKEK